MVFVEKLSEEGSFVDANGDTVYFNYGPYGDGSDFQQGLLGDKSIKFGKY